MAPPTFQYDFSGVRSGFKGKVNMPTGLFINNEFVSSVEPQAPHAVVNPTNGKEIGGVELATEKDIDIAVKAARKAYETVWGLKTSGQERGRLLFKLADLIEQNADELAALESLDNGKPFAIAKQKDVLGASSVIRYYAGWADKIAGDTIEVNDAKFAYTRHEPIGVVGAITPWNFPIFLLSWKLGPALATGNTIVFKPSEFTPLTSLRVAALVKEAGFPPGVLNMLTGLGNVAGAAISSHMDIDKVSFTGSTLVGRHIMKSAAASNLKKVTLELGGKSPTIIFKDADLEQAVKWSAFGILFNHGQACNAGSRIYVEEDIYDEFLQKITESFKQIEVGDPFHESTFQGPQVSQIQYDRIMNYIDIGKKEGASLHLGGERHGTEGYYIQPTIFTDVKPEMTISKEEIFGPVVAIAKFKDHDDIIDVANNSFYGLAAAVFSRDISRALITANKLKAGSVYINSYHDIETNVPFGGYKQSGVGRELGRYALDNFTEVKSVHVNLSKPVPPFV